MKVLFCWLLLLGVAVSGEVSIEVEKLTLHGELLDAKVKRKGVAKIAVVIQPGSGPTDRHGNYRQMKTNCYKLLAKELSASGVAVLQVDKRGVGKSVSKKHPVKEEDLRVAHLVDDLVAWVQFLKKKGYESVYIIGHSEGSLIGMLAAQKEPVAGFISLCGMGRSFDEILIEQISKRAPALLDGTKAILKELKQGKKVEKVDKSLSLVFRPSVQPYLMSLLKHAPAKEIAKLKTSVMIIHGGSDIQVSDKDAEMLDKAMKGATYLKIGGMNHVLKAVGTSALAQQYSYFNPDLPIHKMLPKSILGFIESNE